MDIVIILILLAVFYLVPEIIKRYTGTKKYEYPDIPVPEVAEEIEAVQAQVFDEVAEYKVEEFDYADPAIAKQMEVILQPTSNTDMAWQGKIDPTTMLNGVIFAEILQAPRAYRPWGKMRNKL